MVGQGLERLEKRTPYLLPLPDQVPEGGLSACRVSVIGREYETLYPVLRSSGPAGWSLGPSGYSQARSFINRRKAKHLTRYFWFIFVVSNWSWEGSQLSLSWSQPSPGCPTESTMKLAQGRWKCGPHKGKITNSRNQWGNYRGNLAKPAK